MLLLIECIMAVNAQNHTDIVVLHPKQRFPNGSSRRIASFWDCMGVASLFSQPRS